MLCRDRIPDPHKPIYVETQYPLLLYLDLSHTSIAGSLIDLMIIIPWQVPLNETPVYSSLLKEWLIGLVALLIWSYQIVFTETDCFQTPAWQGKIQRIKREGMTSSPLIGWLEVL